LQFDKRVDESFFEVEKERRATEEKGDKHCKDESSENVAWSVNGGNHSTNRHQNSNNDEEIGEIYQLFIFCFVSSNKGCDGDRHSDDGVVRRERTRRKQVIKDSFCYFSSIDNF
jgi:hypothetical protein